jgi:hypothetical protein
MKKVIAAAAGLMLVGTMAATASADVSFGGDARARFLYQENKDFGGFSVDEDGIRSRENQKENKVTSRFRLQARGTTAGGAYAVGRILMGDGTWDGGNSGTKDSFVDKAYIGVPMGAATLEAGRLYYDLLKTTKFFEQDKGVDGAKLHFKVSDMATIGLWYFLDYEAFQNDDKVDDNDQARYGIYADLKFAGDWGTRLGVVYNDDQVDTDGRDDDGAYGGIEFAGPGGPLAISGALAFDDRGEGDTGYGGFVQGGMKFGATSVALNVGFTDKFFTTDGDFGFIMLGGGSAISAYTIGSEGESNWWIGAPMSFAVSEALTLKGALAYMDMDLFGEGFEISGGATYQISDGANVEFLIGYIGYSQGDEREIDEEDSPFAMGLTFNVKF